MDPVFYLLKPIAYLPSSQAESLLGRTVPNFKDPLSAYQPTNKNKSVFDKGGLHSAAYSDCPFSVANLRSHGHDVDLEGVCRYTRDYGTEVKVNFQTPKLVFIRMEQHQGFLKTLMADPVFREKANSWTRKAIWSGPPVCLIVGVLLCEETAITIFEKAHDDVALRGTLLIATITSAAAGVPFALPFGDNTMCRRLENQVNVHFGGTFRDMQVVGLEVRTLRRSTWRNGVKLKAARIVPGFSGPHLSGPAENTVNLEEFEEKLEDTELEVETSPWHNDDVSVIF